MPDIGTGPLTAFTACAQIDKPTAAIRKWARTAGREKVTLFRSKRRLAVAWLHLNPYKNRLHVHLDVALKTMLGSPPTANTERKELEALLSAISGAEAGLTLYGLYDVPTASLDESRGLVRALSQKATVGDIGVELLGAHLRLTGTPVTDFTWRSWEKSVTGYIELGEQRQVLDETYLISGHARLEALLTSLLGLKV